MIPCFQNPCFCSTNKNDEQMMVTFKIHPIMSTHITAEVSTVIKCCSECDNVVTLHIENRVSSSILLAAGTFVQYNNAEKDNK